MSLNPRPYQSRLVDKAIKKDMIVFLKTGGGKTFIATMLIKELSGAIRGKYSEGAKRSFFVVNSVPLVSQQARYIQPNLDGDLKVGEYYGEKIETWTKSNWDEELENHHVLVMSAQILVDMIQHDFLKLEQINLIVFDECHHATGKHPYVQILNLVKERPELKEQIRYLGLTASLVKTKCNLDKFIESYKGLEKMMGCKIETSEALTANDEEDADTKDRLNSKTRVKVVIYKNSSANQVILERLLNAIDICNKMAPPNSPDTEKIEETERFGLALINFVCRTLKALQAVYQELGLWMFRIALKESHEEIKTFTARSHIATSNDKFSSWVENLFDMLKELTGEAIGCVDEEEENTPAETILANSSSKVKCLLDIFMEPKGDGSRDDFHSIVFVQRIAMAQHLCWLFKRLGQSPEYEHLKCGFLIGNTAISSNDDREPTEFDFKKQSYTLKAFERKFINILFATNVVEEGIDVPKCNMVIRFNEPETFGSYYQSKGRARSSSSCYYVMLDAESMDKRLEDLKNFYEIEEYLAKMALDKSKLQGDGDDDAEEEMSDEEALLVSGVNDMEIINNLIPPYKKGAAQITGLSSLSLISRYSNMLVMGRTSIPPIYQFIKHLTKDGDTLYSATLRLPPNQVFTKTLESHKFRKKKHAKMEVSLDMCKELDELGEMNDNLMFRSNEEWASLHVDLADPKERDLKVKTGSKKHREVYEYSMADEFKKNHVQADVDLYLYAVRICEAPIKPDDPQFERFVKRQVGFLTRKPIHEIPAFKLYSAYNQFSISFELVAEKLRLETRKLQSLQKLHHVIFNEMLNLGLKFDFNDPEKSAWGCLPVLLADDGKAINWSYIGSMRTRAEDLSSVIDEVKQGDLDDYLIRFKYEKNRRGFYQIHAINTDMTPLSEFPAQGKTKTYVDCFKEKGIETKDLSQPLIEIKRLTGLDLNFLNKREFLKHKHNSIKEGNRYICEHMSVLPVRAQYLGSILLLPSVFYRANTILRARKLCLLLERTFISGFGLKVKGRSSDSGITVPVNDPRCSWDTAIKFNRTPPAKLARKDSEDDLKGETEGGGGDELADELPDKQDSKPATDDPPSQLEAPPVSIKESVDPSAIVSSLPSTYHILQCLTLKSANQNFDLERFEILGDCYLKLTVVLKLYCKFSNKKEGDLVTIKSQLVSNKNLFKLAYEKSLNEYIVADSFDAKENWLAPFLASGVDGDKSKNDEPLTSGQEQRKLLNKMYATLNDKSIADCVEALIGLYLQRLGGQGAKMFIEWLEFRISKQDASNEKFSTVLELPEPLLVSRNEFVTIKEAELRKRYADFQSQVLKYEFKNIFYLLEAFTHPSCTKNTLTTSYQRLELVGDAVIDTLITQYIFNDPKEYSPGELTNLRQALVNNKFLAFLAIKYRFCNYLDRDNHVLFSSIQKYLDMNVAYSPWTEFKEPADETDADSDLEDETPKVIADTFEAVAGAIYLDSGCSLDTVWKSFYRFFMPYLEDFKLDIPKSPIKALYELKNGQVKIVADECKPIKYDNGLEAFKFTIQVEGKTFEAIGRSKELARNKVFKKAFLHFKLPK